MGRLAAGDEKSLQEGTPNPSSEIAIKIRHDEREAILDQKPWICNGHVILLQ